MIKVFVKKTNNIFEEISIKGHAKYDLYGKDIVCASVSSLVICTINNIISLSPSSIKYEENNDKVTITIIENNDINNKLLTNMINSIEELAYTYPKNINVTK